MTEIKAQVHPPPDSTLFREEEKKKVGGNLPQKVINQQERGSDHASSGLHQYHQLINNDANGTNDGPSSNSGSSKAQEGTGSNLEGKRQSPKDVFVASSAQNTSQLPGPNLQGSVGTVPLEDLHPKEFRLAPSRKSNKFDTSITKPGVLDDLGKLDEKEVNEKIHPDSDDKLFPWQSVGEFHASGKGSPNTKMSKVTKAYILENFYNDWYCNIATVVGTCFFSWLFAYIGFSWWSMIFIFLGTGTVYNAEYTRFNRNIRDDLKRVTVEETLSDRVESTTWLNSFLSKFWVIYMPVLSQQVKDNVNPQLAGVAPGYGIDALALDEFNLGSKAPSIKGVKSYTKTGKNTVEMDWSFAFTPSDVSDMTATEAREKINPKISLGVTLGKSFVSKTMPILVEDINVAGKMRIKVEFGKVFPNIKIISLQLLEPPLIDFALKPIGGDTLGLDVMSFLPGLKSFVKNIINSNIGPMLFPPNHLDVNVEDIMAAQSKEAIGVLAVTIASADSLKGSDFITNTVDPYIVMSAEDAVPGADEEVRTSIKSDVKNPRWNETKYLLLNSLEQKLNLKCFDFNDVRKDTVIGDLQVDLAELLQSPVLENQTADLRSGTKSKGVLHYSLHWFPVKEDTSEEDAAERAKAKAKGEGNDENAAGEDEDEDEENGQTDVGIAKITLQKVKYLDRTSSMTGSLSPCAELFIDGQKVKSYRTLRRINEPSWGETIEVLVPSKSNSKFVLKIFDDRMNGKVQICEYSSSLDDVISALDSAQESVKGSPQGDIYLDISWKSIEMTGSFAAANSVIEPIGCIKLDVKDAIIKGELSGVGDIDPYYTVSLNRRVLYKSIYHSDTNHPLFDNSTYVPISSPNQTLSVEFYDYQKIGKDRYIGSVQIRSSDVFKKDPISGQYVAINDKNEVSRLNLKDHKHKSTESIVNILTSFIPITPVYSPEELANVKKLETELEQKKKKFETTQKENKQKMKQDPKQWEVAEVEDPFENDEKKINRKAKLSLEDLIKQRSGILSMQILEGSLNPSSAYLEVLADDISYPVFTCMKPSQGKLNSETANVFIRDLKYSKLYLRISKKHVAKDSDDVVSETSYSTLKLLKQAYQEPTWLKFNGSKMKVRFLYTPSSIKLPSSESVKDTGYLNVKLISGHGLKSADRNGYSDPFVNVYVNDKRVFKSNIKKKTLDPVWNEDARIPILSRSKNQVVFNVLDWDRAGDNDDLGQATLDTSKLEVDKTYNWNLELNTQGSIKLQGSFCPEYIKPSFDVVKGGIADKPMKMASGAAFATVGMAGSGLGAATGVATGGLKKGGHLLKSLGGNPMRRSKSGNGNESNGAKKSLEKKSFERKSPSNLNSVNGTPRASLDYDPSVPNTSYAPVQSSSPVVKQADTSSSSSNKKESPNNNSRAGSRASSFARTLAPYGTYNGFVTVVAANNIAKHVQIKVSLTQGGRLKHIYKTKSQKANDQGVALFDEQCSFKASPEANLVLGAISHQRLSRDKDLGIAQINLGDPQIQQDGQISVKLGDGHLIVKVNYGKDKNSQVPPVPEVPQEYTQ
ncbi:tcb3p [Saccharomyces arboricola H-6]|uniref:Tcb3p n=1 Tax=Saccharomyces arboricola (strain H-6 / AS 2.3317 / CBS 10644) TaxID=1160507 RepID=J8PK80_SACAR|nr:tcb3p [Saccharomyces arboricola H-6]